MNSMELKDSKPSMELLDYRPGPEERLENLEAAFQYCLKKILQIEKQLEELGKNES